jgi:hypothetical protein
VHNGNAIVTSTLMRRIERRNIPSMKANIICCLALLLAAVGYKPAQATLYTVTFDHVLIDDDPNYPITGSFLYDSDQLQNPLYGLSNFNVQAVTPYGIFQMNFVWSTDSAFDYLGLGIDGSSNTPAIVLIFALTGNGNGTGQNLLNEAAINGLSVPLITNGLSSSIPGRSVVVSSDFLLLLVARVDSRFGLASTESFSGDAPCRSHNCRTVV